VLTDRASQVVTQQFKRVVRAEIPGHHLYPDRDVSAGERFRLETQQREFRRQRGAVMRADERIHAGGVGVDLFPGPVRHPPPRGRCRTAETNGAKKSILWNGS